MDASQPDYNGRLPIMEAAKSADIRFVNALLQQGVKANSTDPATGNVPIQQAFLKGEIKV